MKPREPVMPRGAVLAALPATLSPELATLVDKPRPGDWLYEIKFDGYRMLARVAGAKDIRIITRRGNDWTARFPALVKALAAAKLPPGWYDGEIVMLNAQGTPDFNALQLAIEGGRNEDIVYYLFDAPYMAGHDLRRVAVEERRALLQSVVTESQRVRFSQEIVAGVHDIVKSACELGLEGVIGKRRGSPYVSRRSDDWIKLKCTKRGEFAIGGYTWPDASRSDAGIGALLLGKRDADGVLHYAGKVGTGFTGEMSARLRAQLDAIAQPKRPFAGATGHDRHATWVRPELSCDATYAEWPEGGSLRHASFKGLREHASSAVPTSVAQPVTLKVTNASRVIDPSTGFTKLDLVSYYARVAAWALPHLKGRPAYIRRAPEGIHKPMVFLQHPSHRNLKGTDPKLWPGHDPAIAFDTPEDLVAAAQVGMVEIHTWNSTDRAIDKPDRIVFDMDPGEGVSWQAMREGALLIRALLEELGLASWLKTTGGKGLHLFVPLKPDKRYEKVRDFSEAVVKHMAATLPDRFVAKLGPRNRVGRIFIDYLRNGWVQSTAEAYSARARPGMGVSMPVGWDELPRIERADQWNIVSAIKRLDSLKGDPWAAYWNAGQKLPSFP